MNAPLRLTEWTSCGGCAAKWGASLLSELVSELPGSFDKSLLVGLAPFDDAAVYKVTDDVALVSTTDFFPPLVDDPDDFGAIAAANACSDVFAMGANVVMAINVAAFPEHFPREAITAIFAAASKVVSEAGGSIAGGHTIRNPEPIFGLAVQGVVHPDKVWRKGGARPGDVVMMSKPIGTALALAGGCSTDKRAAINGMRVLNRRAADQLRELGDDVHAVTDVTGYGLPAMDGKSPNAEVCACTSKRRASSLTRVRPKPPPRDCAPGVIRATAPTSKGARSSTPPILSPHFVSTRRPRAGCLRRCPPRARRSSHRRDGGGRASSRPARPESCSRREARTNARNRTATPRRWRTCRRGCRRSRQRVLGRTARGVCRGGAHRRRSRRTRGA